MRIIRLYVDLPLNAETRVELPEGAAHHLCKVLRAKVGYDISLFNGDGFDYSARVADIGKKSVWVEITGKTSGPARSPVQVHIGQVISKGDRMDYMVQKTTELGVTQITPLFGERCDVRLDEDRQSKRLQHWQQIALHACEQSG
ncbi:MAG: 16S rRNA (uracil(1498)-N(3))-methyltransferase, partial [Bdellovibrionales bacterium]|nr:16S rRNA (uracil(1498)-N(3))-methyltransferase [Bdellovibrionales bacterium]